MSLTFDALQEANSARQDQWENATDKLDLSYFGNAIAGEVGEACNVIKKLERERLGLRGTRATTDQLAEELADSIIYIALAAQKANINLGEAVRNKFNATSKKYGFDILL